MRPRLVKRVFLFSLIALISNVVSSALLCSGAYCFRDSYNETSVFEYSNADFIIPSPSKDQIIELKNNELINEIVPYYFTKTNITYNGKSFLTNVLFFDDLENLDLTPFSKKRCIENHSVNSDSILVDYTFLTNAQCKVEGNTSLTFNGETISFKVAGIYEENSLFDGGAVAIQYSASVRNAIMKNRTKDLPYSGAYISSSNNEQCKNYLYQNYKPLGLLKDRDEFNSDEAYEIYINGFNSTNYSNEIVTIQEFARDHYLIAKGSKIKGFLALISGYLLFFASSILVTLFIDSSKKEMLRIQQSIKKGENKKWIKKYYLLPHYITAFEGLVAISALILICSASPTYMKPFLYLTFAAIEIALLLTSFVINILFSNKKVDLLFKKKQLVEKDTKNEKNAS